jgi:ABC-type uncharacterized transport system permease subunit
VIPDRGGKCPKNPDVAFSRKWESSLLKRLWTPAVLFLLAIRENPNRARAVSYDITLYNLLVFILTGFFTGLAGGLFALFMKMVYQGHR